MTTSCVSWSGHQASNIYRTEMFQQLNVKLPSSEPRSVLPNQFSGGDNLYVLSTLAQPCMVTLERGYILCPLNLLFLTTDVVQVLQTFRSVPVDLSRFLDESTARTYGMYEDIEKHTSGDQPLLSHAPSDDWREVETDGRQQTEHHAVLSQRLRVPSNRVTWQTEREHAQLPVVETSEQSELPILNASFVTRFHTCLSRR